MRSNTARLKRRFRVTAFHHDAPYLTGDVEYLSDACQPSDTLRDLQEEVERLSRAYVMTVLALWDEHVGQVGAGLRGRRSCHQRGNECGRNGSDSN